MNFKISVIPRATQKFIRFPNEVIEKIEDIIKGKDCTFSLFAIKDVKEYLKNIEELEN